MSLLRDGIKEGCVVMREPNGTMHLFGDALAEPSMRAELHVRDPSFFFRVAAEADVGLSRAYIAGQWACDDLAALFRIFIANRDRTGSGFTSTALWTSTVGRLLNMASYSLFLDNTLAGSRANIHAHYDLSNALFETFLDPTTMAYSCGRFRVDGVDAVTGKPRFGGSLDEAQVRKLDDLIALADVQPGHQVLDIGCGGGGMAIRLAQTRGCSVVGITLSTEQKEWGEKRVKALGLEELVRFELIDYRVFADRHAGEFDRIITVEMIEAVGYSHLGEFMGACGRVLKPTGLMVMQAITMPEPRYEEYKHSADFINTIIFPGGHCPCVTSLTDAMARTSDMTLEHVQNYALHYAETLRVWQRNFNAHLDRVHALGFDAAFVRMWNYYLTYCEAGFETQTLGLHALVFAKPAALQQY
jgi:cyclopropane-fatty-acyl-phospholipid synthase